MSAVKCAHGTIKPLARAWWFREHIYGGNDIGGGRGPRARQRGTEAGSPGPILGCLGHEIAPRMSQDSTANVSNPPRKCEQS